MFPLLWKGFLTTPKVGVSLQVDMQLKAQSVCCQSCFEAHSSIDVTDLPKKSPI